MKDEHTAIREHYWAGPAEGKGACALLAPAPYAMATTVGAEHIGWAIAGVVLVIAAGCAAWAVLGAGRGRR